MVARRGIGVWSAVLACVALLAVRAGADRLTGDAAEAFKAAGNGDVEKLERLVKAQPALLTATESFGETLLARAVKQGQTAAVKALLKAGADPNPTDRMMIDGLPLTVAAGQGQADLVEALLAGGAKPGANGRRGTPLQAAAARGHTRVVKMLLAAGANPGQRSEMGDVPLCSAAKAGFVDTVEALLDAKADPDDRDRTGTTALEYAVRGGNDRMVRLMLDRGANASLALGDPPLTPDEVKDTAKLGKRIEEVNAAFREFLPAVAAGNLARVKECVRLYPKLVQVGAGEPGYRKKTVLAAAVEGGNKDVIEFLLTKGAAQGEQ